MTIEEYRKPSDLSEAYAMLIADPKNVILGGGAWMKLSSGQIFALIALDGLGLEKIIENEDNYEIGSKATLRDVERHPLSTSLAGGILNQALKSIMGVPLRNLATIGGTIVGRYGFSDLLTALLAMDVTLRFYQTGELPLRDYLQMKKPERDILLSIRIRKTNSKGYYHKIAKTALDFAILNLAVTKTDDHFKIVVGARPGIATYAFQAMDYLSNLDYLTLDAIRIASEIAAKELEFSSNQKASKEYRFQLAKVYVERGLKAVTGYAD